MGKPTGFLEYDRVDPVSEDPKERIKNWNEFHEHLSLEEQKKQGARCMDCGVPFCQSGMMLAGMTSGCPLHNLCPEWNDLVYHCIICARSGMIWSITETGRRHTAACTRLTTSRNLPQGFVRRSARRPAPAVCTGMLSQRGKMSMRSLSMPMSMDTPLRSRRRCVQGRRWRSSAPARPDLPVRIC